MDHNVFIGHTRRKLLGPERRLYDLYHAIETQSQWLKPAKTTIETACNIVVVGGDGVRRQGRVGALPGIPALPPAVSTFDRVSHLTYCSTHISGGRFREKQPKTCTTAVLGHTEGAPGAASPQVAAMGAQCVAVGRNSDGHTKSCLGRDCTIRLFAYKPTNNYNAPTCSDAKVDDDSWISVPPKTLATYRQQALSNLGRSLRGHHDFTKKDLRLCWNIFKWWPGSAARGNSAYGATPTPDATSLSCFLVMGLPCPSSRPWSMLWRCPR